MRVAVTGGVGKLGEWVVRELRAPRDGGAPHEVVVLDRVAGPEQEGVRYVVGDVTDLGQVMGTVAGADAIVHLAAIRRWGIAPNEVTFGTNVTGTFNVHEAAWLLGIRRVVAASSEAVLGWDYREREFPPDYLPIAEPLATAMPRWLPATAAMARPFTGSQPSVSNARAKELLGWQPHHSWRRPEP